MSNMSYCRFENTASDIRDCEEALSEMIDNPEECEPVNRYELAAIPGFFSSAAAMIQMLIENAGGTITVEMNGEQIELDRVDWEDAFRIVHESVIEANSDNPEHSEDEEGEE